MVNLIASSEQQMIVDSVASFLDDAMPVSRLRRGTSDSERWTQMGELGLFGLSIPEADGGSGLGPVEEALVFRQLGRNLLSPGVIASAIGANVAFVLGENALAADIVAGNTRVALAQHRGLAGEDKRVCGSFQLYDPQGTDWILVVNDAGDAALVPRDAAINDTVVASAVDALAIHTASIDTDPGLFAGREHGLGARLPLLAGAMLAGVCDGARDLASDYAKMREQFGQPIGAFQAIKHKCADMCVRADAVGSLLNYAAVATALDRPDAAFQTTALKLLGGQYALISAKEAIQVHGGIGFTMECDAHHFLKRAHVYDQIGGTSRRQQQLLLLADPHLALDDAA